MKDCSLRKALVCGTNDESRVEKIFPVGLYLLRMIKESLSDLFNSNQTYNNILFRHLILKDPFLNYFLNMKEIRLKDQSTRVIKAHCSQQRIAQKFMFTQNNFHELLLSIIFTGEATFPFQEIFQEEHVEKYPLKSNLNVIEKFFNAPKLEDLPTEKKEIYNFYKHIPPHFYLLTERFQNDLRSFFRFEGIDEKKGFCGCLDKHPFNPFSCGFDRRIKIYEPYEMGYAVGSMLEGRKKYKDILQKEGVVNFDPSVLEMMSFIPFKVRSGEETLESFKKKNEEYKYLFYKKWHAQIRSHLSYVSPKEFSFLAWYALNFGVLEGFYPTFFERKPLLQQFHNFNGFYGWLWVGRSLPFFPLLHYSLSPCLTQKKDQEYIKEVSTLYSFFPHKKIKKIIKKYQVRYLYYKDRETTHFPFTAITWLQEKRLYKRKLNVKKHQQTLYETLRK